MIAKGFRILARRFRTPVGEIDIVARPTQHTGVRRGQGARHARRGGRGRHRPQQAPHRGGRRSLAAAHPGRSAQDMRFDAVLVAPGKLPRHIPAAFEAS